MRISERIGTLAGSATLALDAKVQALRKEGVDVVDFGAGQPDFPTPDHIKEAAYSAIRENRTRYTPAAGLPEAREAVAQHLRDPFGLEYRAQEEVLVTNGAKQAIFNAVHALADPGDEVILFSPYWVSYPEQVKSSGAVPVIVPTEDLGFRLDLDRVEAAITDRTRAMIVNSPNNPTGTLYTRDELEGLARLAAERDLAVISDEIYGAMLYDDAEFVPFPSISDDARARTVVVGAVSKTYSMTGWRLGWAAGPSSIVKPMIRLQSHSTSNACTISQWAAIEALTGDQSETGERLAQFAKRRDRMMQRMSEIDGLRCVAPGGAFFAFPRVDHYFGGDLDGQRIEDSLSFADAVLEHARVAVVPGMAFGCDAFVRLSYATSLDQIEEGMSRLASLLGKIRQPA